MISLIGVSSMLSAEGIEIRTTLRAHGRPLADHVGPMPYVKWQQLQDATAPAGKYYYWKTANYTALGDSTLQQLAAAIQAGGQ